MVFVEWLKAFTQFPFPQACFLLAILLVSIVAFGGLNPKEPIKHPWWLIIIAAVLAVISILTTFLPTATRKGDPAVTSKEPPPENAEYSLDRAKINQLYFTKSGTFQIRLENDFPNGCSKWQVKDFWANGNELPDVIKNALVEAKTRNATVAIVVRGRDNTGKKLLVDEVYIGEEMK